MPLQEIQSIINLRESVINASDETTVVQASSLLSQVYFVLDSLRRLPRKDGAPPVLVKWMDTPRDDGLMAIIPANPQSPGVLLAADGSLFEQGFRFAKDQPPIERITGEKYMTRFGQICRFLREDGHIHKEETSGKGKKVVFA